MIAVLLPFIHTHSTPQDYDGPEDDADAGMQYFRKRFVRLTQKANKMLEKKKPSHGERDLAPPLNARQVYTQ